MRTCSIEGCAGRHMARSLCMKHYHKLRRHGDPRAGYEILRGDGYIDKNGYHVISVNGIEIYEHIVIAERALGRKLPPGALVHHVNEIRSDNTPGNLVVCPSRGYHATLHRRMRALAACGHPDWRMCRYCRLHDAPSRLLTNHSSCRKTIACQKRSQLHA